MDNPQDLMNHKLNLVDSIKDQFIIIDETERKKISEKYDEIIRIWTSFLAALRWQIQDLERQIENERNRPLGVVLNRDEFLEFCEAFLEFYRNYVRMVFFLVDVTTAYKHLKLAETDWEYRFFARRIYTLMYETYGSDGAYLKAQKRINEKVGREIIVGAYSPSYGFEKKQEENEEIYKMIEASGANVVLVGVGAPKQEKWIMTHKDRMPGVKVWMALGATIDFEAGNIKRAPKIYQKLALEWLYRMWCEPKRMFKRYICDDLVFFWYLLKQVLGVYKNPWKELGSISMRG